MLSTPRLPRHHFVSSVPGKKKNRRRGSWRQRSVQQNHLRYDLSLLGEKKKSQKRPVLPMLTLPCGRLVFDFFIRHFFYSLGFDTMSREIMR